MIIKEWYVQHELTIANYYHRLIEIRKACLHKLMKDIVSQSIITISAEIMNKEYTTETPSELEVSVNGILINVAADTFPEILKMVL